ncbi:hypothetical protein CEXT_306431 [Caerostris extrusa]|uniref:Uncharacterized protein n=1 Tax=Caerostris extrusa TaxID=172846 RepID=A0AAV4UDC5_CAEEX|nr:hypothetical protein CEXT_306431 [Caerostris extrusa]
MNDMEISTEGNGPYQDHRIVLSPQAVDATKNANAKDNEKVSPKEKCRQISTAMKEMDVIDIVEQSKRSDLPQDYIQMNENLLQKRQYLVEWVSRFHCPISDGTLHNPNVNIRNVIVKSKVNVSNVNNGKVNASNVNKGNLKSKVDAPIKNKSKLNASQIASNDGAKDSGEFQTPNKKLIAKATFTYSKDTASDAICHK